MIPVWLCRIENPSWEALQRIGAEQWFWMDTDVAASGLHLAEALPERPDEVTHVWGWSDDLLVRARVDLDLPGGVAGALLYLRQPDRDASAISADLDRGRLWDPTDGRVHSDPAAPIFAGDPEVTTWTVWVEHRSENRTWRMPLQFFRREAG